MHIWNGCNALNIAGNPMKDINANLTFLRSASKVERWLITPLFWHLVAILEILLLHVLSNDACKFAINLLPITWESFENVNLLYFYCKCTFEMAVMHLILQETPWKISMQNLHFCDQHQKLKDDWSPIIWPGSHLNFFSLDLAWT